MTKSWYRCFQKNLFGLFLLLCGILAGCGIGFNSDVPPTEQLKAFCGLVWGQGGNPDVIWLGGSNGLLLKSENGGVDFDTGLTQIDYNINDLGFSPDGNYGYALGDVGLYSRSADGGNTWEPQMLGTEFFPNLHQVTWAPGNPQVGWIVGDLGAIYYTNDQGINWGLQDSGTMENLHGICFFDEFEGWAVGDNGTILGTNDGGQNWQPQDSGVSVGLHYCFNDGNFGLAAGLGGTILRTNDFGQNWEPLNTGVTNDLYVLAVNPQKNGTVLAGGDGVILRSPDFGNSWVTVLDEFQAQIDLVIKKMAYALGGGQVLATGYTGLGQGFDFEGVPGLLPENIIPTSDGLLMRSDDDGANFLQVDIKIQF